MSYPDGWTVQDAPGLTYPAPASYGEADVTAHNDDATAHPARRAAAQANSTATLVSDLVVDFNALLAKLRAAGLMAS